VQLRSAVDEAQQAGKVLDIAFASNTHGNSTYLTKLLANTTKHVDPSLCSKAILQALRLPDTREIATFICDVAILVIEMLVIAGALPST